MYRISNNKQSLAALSIFKKLYNNGKDVFQVISEFERYLILRDTKHRFTTIVIHDDLNKDFGLDVPLSVIKAGLKRLDFIDKERDGGYSLNEKFKDQNINDFKKDIKDINSASDNILSQLKFFVESKSGKNLSGNELKKLEKSLYSYILDEEDYTGEYASYISAFFLNHKDDIDFTNQIDDSIVGAIIFSGFNYNTTEYQIDKLDAPINMFLETEILFHMAGYNGILYKQLFDEFYALVKEINQRSKQPIIRLYYFEETKEEIDKYFRSAERLLIKHGVPDYYQTAMYNIISGC